MNHNGQQYYDMQLRQERERKEQEGLWEELLKPKNLILIGVTVIVMIGAFYLNKSMIDINIPRVTDFPIVNSKQVTFLINSCNRYDLLNVTLRSFFKHNTYPLAEIIVVEDGPYRQNISELMAIYSNITWVFLGQQLGQFAAVDKSFQLVKTDWVFHSQDDWTYLKPGFIEASMDYLNAHPNVVNVYLRNQTVELDPKTGFVKKDWIFGFSFNPGLYRMRDYRLLPKGYCKVISDRVPPTAWGATKEVVVGNYYKRMGFDTAQLINETRNDYIIHNGDGRHAM